MSVILIHAHYTSAIAGTRVEVYGCNLSQLRDRDDLNREFFNAFQILLRGKTPLIFFDEFDCRLGDDEFGWLKYFLEPMQDGRFRHPHGVGELRDSIFVFAGGICKSYERFNSRFSGETSNSKLESAKGPDFVSRLHGYFDVPSINTGIDAGYGGPPYVRRAIILRSLMEQDKYLLGANRSAQIDRNIVDAFLRVKKYYHGARSIGAIFRMCMRWSHRIEKVSLPSREQLDLHTDGEEFLRYVTSPEHLLPWDDCKEEPL